MALYKHVLVCDIDLRACTPVRARAIKEFFTSRGKITVVVSTSGCVRSWVTSE